MTSERNIDEFFMTRCLELAKHGLGLTYPNPMVGSVIVHNGKIIGEGYHVAAGQPHAEVNAVNSVRNKLLLKESTLYVSLEPCAHFGRTPPCAQMIIDNHIPRVVIGCVDTFSKVAGKGIEMLKQAGVDVKVGVLNEKARHLNRRFFTFNEQQRPFIILKWAQSADGYIDAQRQNDAKPIWITNDQARICVHKQRTEEQSILIGTNTALFDNPQLTARDWHGNQPLRIVLDNKLRLSNDLKLFSVGVKTLVLNSIKQSSEGAIEFCKINFDSNLPANVVKSLYEHGLQSVIIEGGRQTLQTFIDAGLWDEAYVYYGNVVLNAGTEAPRLNAILKDSCDIGDCKLRFYTKK